MKIFDLRAVTPCPMLLPVDEFNISVLTDLSLHYAAWHLYSKCEEWLCSNMKELGDSEIVETLKAVYRFVNENRLRSYFPLQQLTKYLWRMKRWNHRLELIIFSVATTKNALSSASSWSSSSQRISLSTRFEEPSGILTKYGPSLINPYEEISDVPNLVQR